MRRIGLAVVLALGLVVLPLAVEAQQRVRVHRGPESAPRVASCRWCRDARLPDLAAELVRLNVEVIVTMAAPAAVAAKRASPAIPIVFMAVGDPVALGLVPSLARPGGTITGFTHLTVDLTGKRLELFKEAVPSLKSVVVLTDPANPTTSLAFKEAQIAAHRLGLQVRLIEVRHL